MLQYIVTIYFTSFVLQIPPYGRHTHSQTCISSTQAAFHKGATTFCPCLIPLLHIHGYPLLNEARSGTFCQKQPSRFPAPSRRDSYFNPSPPSSLPLPRRGELVDCGRLFLKVRTDTHNTHQLDSSTYTLTQIQALRLNAQEQSRRYECGVQKLKLT
jgi:hypothetical protein